MRKRNEAAHDMASLSTAIRLTIEEELGPAVTYAIAMVGPNGEPSGLTGTFDCKVKSQQAVIIMLDMMTRALLAQAERNGDELVAHGLGHFIELIDWMKQQAGLDCEEEPGGEKVTIN